MKVVDGLPAADWDVGGVCGVWSAKMLMLHLAVYEHVLAEALGLFAGGAPAATPHLDDYKAQTATYNDDKVALRHSKTPTEVLDEYRTAYEAAVALLDRIAPEKLREVGTIPWSTRMGPSTISSPGTASATSANTPPRSPSTATTSSGRIGEGGSPGD